MRAGPSSLPYLLRPTLLLPPAIPARNQLSMQPVDKRAALGGQGQHRASTGTVSGRAAPELQSQLS